MDGALDMWMGGERAPQIEGRLELPSVFQEVGQVQLVRFGGPQRSAGGPGVLYTLPKGRLACCRSRPRDIIE